MLPKMIAEPLLLCGTHIFHPSAECWHSRSKLLEQDAPCWQRVLRAGLRSTLHSHSPQY